MDIKLGVNIGQFLSANKSMIEAPAGHGKTHSIVDCLEQFDHKDKKILILTHTHAGIASIKAHFRLVTIHHWGDGNGRTTRLVMNMIQRQLGLIPSYGQPQPPSFRIPR